MQRKLLEARGWLAETLIAAGHSGMAVENVRKLARLMGYSWRTVELAKAADRNTVELFKRGGPDRQARRMRWRRRVA